MLAALGWPESGLATDGRLDEYDHVGVMAQHTPDITFADSTADGESGRRLQSTLEEAISRWMSGGPVTPRAMRPSSAGRWARSAT